MSGQEICRVAVNAYDENEGRFRDLLVYMIDEDVHMSTYGLIVGACLRAINPAEPPDARGVPLQAPSVAGERSLQTAPRVFDPATDGFRYIHCRDSNIKPTAPEKGVVTVSYPFHQNPLTGESFPFISAAEYPVGAQHFPGYVNMLREYISSWWYPAACAPFPAGYGTHLIAPHFIVSCALKPFDTRTTSGIGTIFDYLGSFSTMLVELVVDAVSGTAPTLDVFVDAEVTPGYWINIIRFAQMTDVGRRAAQISEHAAGSTSDFNSAVDLAAGTVRQGAWGSRVRARWIIGGTTPSFTFGIHACLKS